MGIARTWRTLVGVCAGLGLLVLAGCMWLQPINAVDFEADPVSGAAPRLVDFQPIIEADVAAYEWDFGDGAASTEEAPAHIYRSQGTYTVSLTVQFADGTSRHVVKDDLIDVGPPATSGPGGAAVYWLDRSAGTIYAGSTDGSVSFPLVTGIYKGQYFAVGGGWVYWTTQHAVKRASVVDGSGQELLYTDMGSIVAGIAVDAGAQRIYWVSHPVSLSESGAIWKADLDGSNQRAWGTLTRWGANSHVSWLLAVDSVSQRLYWFEHFFEVDTSGPILPVSLGAGSVLPSDWTPQCSLHWAPTTGFDEHVIRESLPASKGLALDVGLTGVGARYVYWTDPRSDEIVRCKPDGSAYVTVVENLDDPVALAVNAAYGRIYWSDSKGIHRANLDGTSRELVFPGVQADALVLDY